jgi:Fe-S-cluster containining protein
VLLKERYRVYFPFVDGLLAYNCPKCGYRCCKGAGFAATPSEFVTLRKHYPALAYFSSVAQKATEPLVQMVNFSPQCFFLRDDGLCDVHAQHGRAAKPFVCKSFPINAFRLEGDTLVADVNFLCPIELASGAPGDERIHHADLLRDIVEHEDIVVAAATRPRAAALSHARIDLEERLRERCASLPLVELCAIYEASSRAPGMAFEDEASVVADHRRGLERFRAAMAGFLRAPDAWRGGDDEIDRLVAALAPRMRLIAALEYPWLAPDDATALVARVLVSLALYARLVRTVNGSPITLATIHGLFAQFGYVIYFLAHIDRVPGIEALADDKWTFQLAAGARSDAQRLLTFIYVENDDAGCTLGEIFDRLHIDDVVARLQVLQALPVEAMKLIAFRKP